MLQQYLSQQDLTHNLVEGLYEKFSLSDWFFVQLIPSFLSNLFIAWLGITFGWLTPWLIGLYAVGLLINTGWVVRYWNLENCRTSYMIGLVFGAQATLYMVRNLYVG